MEGSWSLQSNLYIQERKKQNKFQQRISLLNKLSKVNTDLSEHDKKYYVYKDKSFSLLNHENKITTLELNKDRKLCLSIKNVSNNLFQVTCKYKNNKVYYDEKLYIINKNIMISITLLKNTKNNKNIGLKVTSYVRSLQDKIDTIIN